MRKLPLVACVFAGIACGERLAPTEPGVPAELGGDVRAEHRGNHIHHEARLPEPGGKVLARSIGKNPVWEKDALGSPELEDRVRWVLRYTGVGGGRSLSIEVNPWGAYRIEEAGEVLKDTEIRRRAEVTALGWTVEASVPVGLLDLDWSSSRVRVEAERIRSRSALAPEFRWRADLGSLAVTRAGGPPPQDLPAPRLGNTDPPLEIGRLTHLPPVVATWDSPEWRDVPAFELPRNEPFPRAPRYRTQVKWVHDGRTLALLARLEEPEPVVARAGGRDSTRSP